MNGKGDTPRPVDWQKWERNFDRIFRKPKRKAKAKAKPAAKPSGDALEEAFYKFFPLVKFKQVELHKPKKRGKK